MNFLDKTGLAYLWSKIKAYITEHTPTKVSQLTNDKSYATTDEVNTLIANAVTNALQDEY